MKQAQLRLSALAKRSNRLFGPMRWTSLIATVILALGCSKRDLGPWKEEVRLSDGRVIVVERFESFEVTTPIGDPGSAFVQSAQIKIIAPAELAGVPELVIRYRPVVFDYDATNNVWFAIGVNDNACSAPPAHMDPNGRLNIHPNFEFRLDGSEWRGVEIGPERLGLAANLLIQRKSIDEFDIFPLAEKSRLDASEGLPREYRSIQAYVSCR